MALIDLKLNPTRRELRQFGLIVLPIVAVIVASLARWKWHHPSLAMAVVAAALLAALLGAIAPSALRPIFVALSVLAYPVGWTVSLLLLGAVFFLVLTPIAAMMRLAGEDPMARKLDRNAGSYWVERRRKRDPESYFRQF